MSEAQEVKITKNDLLESLNEIIDSSKTLNDKCKHFSKDRSLSDLERALYSGISSCAATNEYLALVVFNFAARSKIEL